MVEQPTRGRAGHSWSLYLALLQVGFDRRCVTADGRALLPPDFTLAPDPKGREAVCFCATFRLPLRIDPYTIAWELPSTLPGGARTFLPFRQNGFGGGHPVRTALHRQSSIGPKKRSN